MNDGRPAHRFGRGRLPRWTAAVHAVVVGTDIYQVFGTWSGHVTSDDGAIHHVEGISDFTEESRSRW